MIHSAKACFAAAEAMIAGGNRPSLTEVRAERAGGIWALGNKFKTRFCRNMMVYNNGRPYVAAYTYILQYVFPIKQQNAITRSYTVALLQP